MQYTPEEVVEKLLDFTEELHAADDFYRECIEHEKDWTSRNVREMAHAWKQAKGRSREEREAEVKAACLESHVGYKHAVNRTKYALEHQRNVRQQLSALQSVNGNVRDTMQFERTTP